MLVVTLAEGLRLPYLQVPCKLELLPPHRELVVDQFILEAPSATRSRRDQVMEQETATDGQKDHVTK